MAYVTVYAPDGQKFEVASRDRADKLILQEGWTQTPPVAEEKPKRASRKKKEEPVEEEIVLPESEPMLDFEENSFGDES